jgi:uncharacterized protein (TIGR02266 family)
MPAFSLVMAFGKSGKAVESEAFVRGLTQYFPRERLVELRLATPAEEAVLLLRLSFDSYPRALVESLTDELSRGAGELFELQKMDSQARDELWTRRLDKPQFVKDFATAAERIATHLKGLLLAEAQVAWTRKAKRYAVELEVEFRTERDFVLEHATNISSGGVFVRTVEPPAIGSLVELKLTLPNGTRLSTTARAAHLREGEGGGVGLQFTGTDAVFQQAIDDYIAELAR